MNAIAVAEAECAALTERRAMIITPDRVVYGGLLGSPSCRTLGALTVYVALETPFEIRIAGDRPARAFFAVVPPNSPHEIKSADRLVGKILIEPECVRSADVLRFPGLVMTASSEQYRELHEAFKRWLHGVATVEPTTAAVDRFFFGRTLEARGLDQRVERAVQQIRAQPCERFFAAECARVTGLSFSRFVHIFKAEMGMTFRAFCAWKRARAVLPYVTSSSNLTQLAMQTGYPDSTHFSHSIRRIFGLRPRDVLAGSRRLILYGD